MLGVQNTHGVQGWFRSDGELFTGRFTFAQQKSGCPGRRWG